VNSSSNASICAFLQQARAQPRESYSTLSFYYFHDSIYQVKKKQISFMIVPTKPLSRVMGISYEIDSDEEIELNEAEDCENISEIDEVLNSCRVRRHYFNL